MYKLYTQSSIMSFSGSLYLVVFIMHSLIVFDIETVPDTDSCFGLTGVDTSDVTEMRNAMTNYHLEITEDKNPFLRQLFHRVVVISILQVNITIRDNYEFFQLKKISSGDISSHSERELVQFFFDHLCKKIPRIVSFNGRTFDIPVLKYRAMKYGIVAKEFYLAGDKWNNYNNKYSAHWHTDLIDILSDYGSSARVKMSEVCAAFGLPGKLGLDGSKVMSLYDKGKIAEIKHYCEIDVLNTYLIYLLLLRHQGKISREGYSANVSELHTYLVTHTDDNPSYSVFAGTLEQLLEL